MSYTHIIIEIQNYLTHILRNNCVASEHLCTSHCFQYLNTNMQTSKLLYYLFVIAKFENKYMCIEGLQNLSLIMLGSFRIVMCTLPCN